jgi:uncharacterized membrane protein YeaQ/YmgE (transglycosylase-associated protein family)
MGAFFSMIFGTLFGWIAQYFTKKLAYGTAVAGALLAVTTTFYVTMKALIDALGGAITDPWLLMGFYSCLPDNTVTCLTVCFSAEILSFLYRHQLMTIKAVSSAT